MYVVRYTHTQAPHCLDQVTLEDALRQAQDSPLRDVPADARLASDHVATLTSLGNPDMLTDLFTELRTVSVPLPLPSTLHPPPSTLHPLPSTFYSPPSPLSLPHQHYLHIECPSTHLPSTLHPPPPSLSLIRITSSHRYTSTQTP